jgi:hypothetical protein
MSAYPSCSSLATASASTAATAVQPYSACSSASSATAFAVGATCPAFPAGGQEESLSIQHARADAAGPAVATAPAKSSASVTNAPLTNFVADSAACAAACRSVLGDQSCPAVSAFSTIGRGCAAFASHASGSPRAIGPAGSGGRAVIAPCCRRSGSTIAGYDHVTEDLRVENVAEKQHVAGAWLKSFYLVSRVACGQDIVLDKQRR